MKIPFSKYSLKLVKTKEHNVFHHDVKTLVEYAFTLKDLDGKNRDYWCFKNLLDMPKARYSALMDIQQELTDRMTREERMLLVDLAFECINALPGEGVRLSGVIDVLNIFKYADQMALEMSIFNKILTCYYYDATMNEDVTVYDIDFNKEKAKIFDSQPPDSFFLSEPIRKLLPLEEPSADDLRVCLAQTKIKRDLMERLIGEIRKNLNISAKPGRQEAEKE